MLLFMLINIYVTSRSCSTNSMEDSSSEANSRSAVNKLSASCGTPKLHCRFHKSSQMDPILSQQNPNQNP